MSNNKIYAIIFSVVCFVNAYWCITGKAGFEAQGEPMPLLALVCLVGGFIGLYVAFSGEDKGDN
jgi:hypothetical protein